MNRPLDRECLDAVQVAIVQALKQKGVATDELGLVVLLTQPNDGGTETLHLGARGLPDDAVLELLAAAPDCVHATQAQEAKNRGSA